MVAKPTPWARAPSIWPWTWSGLIARPTSWTVATWATRASLVELAGAPVVVLELALDGLVEQQRQGRQGDSLVVDDLAPGQPAAGRTGPLQNLGRHQPGGLTHGAACHPGLAGGG